MDDKFRSRKFLFACFYTVVATISLYSGHLSGTEFVTLAGTILGLYKLANVMEKRNN